MITKLWRRGLIRLGSVKHKCRVKNGISIAGDDNLLIEGSEGNIMYVYSIPSGNQVAMIGEPDKYPGIFSRKIPGVGHKSIIQSFSVHCEGTILATGADDHLVMLWDIPSGRLLNTINGHNKSVKGLLWLNKDLLLTVDSDSSFRTWDVSGKGPFLKLDLKGRLGEISIIGDTLAVANHHGRVQLFSLSTGTPLPFTDKRFGQIYSMGFDPSGEMLAVGMSSSVEVWNRTATTPLHSFTHGGRVQSVEFSNDGKLLLTVAPVTLTKFCNVMDMSTGLSIGAIDKLGVVLGARFVEDTILLTLHGGTRVLLELPDLTEIVRFTHDNNNIQSFIAIAKSGIIATFGNEESGRGEATVFWGPNLTA